MVVETVRLHALYTFVRDISDQFHIPAVKPLVEENTLFIEQIRVILEQLKT